MVISPHPCGSPSPATPETSAGRGRPGPTAGRCLPPQEVSPRLDPATPRCSSLFRPSRPLSPAGPLRASAVEKVGFAPGPLLDRTLRAFSASGGVLVLWRERYRGRGGRGERGHLPLGRGSSWRFTTLAFSSAGATAACCGDRRGR